MYSHVIRIRYAIKDRCSSSRIDVIYHFLNSRKLVYVELGEAMAPRPYQVHECTIIHSLHQEYHPLILKLNPPFFCVLRRTPYILSPVDEPNLPLLPCFVMPRSLSSYR